MRRRFTGGRKPLSEVGQLIEHLLHLVGVDNSSFGFRFVRTNCRLKEFENIFQTVRFPAFLLEVVPVLVHIGGFHFKELGQALAFGGVLKHMKNALAHIAFANLAFDSYLERIRSTIRPFVEVLRIPELLAFR